MTIVLRAYWYKNETVAKSVCKSMQLSTSFKLPVVSFELSTPISFGLSSPPFPSKNSR